jgi:hypothetical protein
MLLSSLCRGGGGFNFGFDGPDCFSMWPRSDRELAPSTLTARSKSFLSRRMDVEILGIFSRPLDRVIG